MESVIIERLLVIIPEDPPPSESSWVAALIFRAQLGK